MSTYIPTDWTKEVPIDESNLNHTERGVEDAHTEIEEIAIGNTAVNNADEAEKVRFIPAATNEKLGGIKLHNIVDSISGEVTSVITAPAITDPPGAVIDFNASDNLPGVIRMDFTPATDTLYHNLFRDDELVASDINPGFLYRTSEGTWNFYIQSNNLFGSTTGIHDSGTSRKIPTEPPAPIEDFTASDNKVLKVIFAWTDHEDAYKFNLYAGSTLLVEDIRPGYQHVAEAGTVVYSLQAINFLGTTTSNEDPGTALTLAPSTVQNFTASDSLVATIQTLFDYIPQPAVYDLYREGILYRNNVYSTFEFAALDDTWDFFIRASNAVGHTDSDVDSGTSLPALYPPGEIFDFAASDDFRREIRIDFTPAVDAGKYDLYRDDILFLQDVFPGKRFDSEVGTWSFRIAAVNGKGTTYGNYDDGTAVRALTGPPGDITDFTASDTLVNAIQIQYTRATQATRHDLFRQGVPYKTDVHSGDVFPTFEGTWEFNVRAVNPLGVSTVNNVDSGTALSAESPPAAIIDFTASDDRDNQILVDFTMVSNAARYDLYRNNEKIEEDIAPGYVYFTEAGTWTFHVKALNLLGTTDSNEESGTALASDLPPSKIEDFDASDDITGYIVMTYTPATGAVSHDLYRDNALLVVNIQSGYPLISSTNTIWTFNVVAINDIDSTPSNVNDGSAIAPVNPPSYDGSLIASTNEIGQVTVTWNGVSDADYYDLYVNGSILQEHATSGYVHTVPAGTRAYQHNAVNAGGREPSNVSYGTSIGETVPPIAVSDFAATTCYIDKIIFTWSNTPNTDSYDLYDDNGVLAYNVLSGETIYPGAASSGSYYVKSNGGGTSANSNSDLGSTWESSGELEFDSVTSGTIVGGVNVPADATIYICMVAGGGSGAAANFLGGAANGGTYGGHGGNVVNTIIQISCGESHNYAVGRGGAAVSAIPFSHIDGERGNDSTYDDITAYGGEGGSYASMSYEGNETIEDAIQVCGFLTHDGTFIAYEGEWYAWGGEKSAGVAGSGKIEELIQGDINGNRGAGGGAATRLTATTAVSGSGGDGYLKVSW